MTAYGDWLVTLSVTGPAGAGDTAPQKVGIDPRRPPDSPAYALSQMAIPIVVVILLLAFFRLRHVALERWPAGRDQANGSLGRRLSCKYGGVRSVVVPGRPTRRAPEWVGVWLHWPRPCGG
jgi:hypothetical protein